MAFGPAVPVLLTAPGTLQGKVRIGALVAVAETATVPAGDSAPTVTFTTGGGSTMSVIVTDVEPASEPSGLVTVRPIVYEPFAVTVRVGIAAVALSSVPPLVVQA